MATDTGETRRDRRDANVTHNDPTSDGERLGRRREVIPPTETGAEKARREAGPDGIPDGTDKVTEARLRGDALEQQTRPHDALESRSLERHVGRETGAVAQNLEGNQDELADAQAEADEDRDQIEERRRDRANAQDEPAESGAQGESTS